MKNELPKRFSSNIEERPVYMSNRRNMQVYDDLANTLEMLDATKSVVLSISEAVCLFGKSFKTNIRMQLAKRGMAKIKVATKDGRVHVWLTKV